MKIEPGKGDGWDLEVRFAISGPIGRYEVELKLDRQMIPLAVEYEAGSSSVQVGVPFALTMDMNLSGRMLRVDPEHRLVAFGVNWFDLKRTWRRDQYSVRKTIGFKWVSKLRPAQAVVIGIKVRGPVGRPILEEDILGFDVSSSALVPVLTTGPSGKSFYYSSNPALELSEYRDVMRIGSAVLDRGESISWAFTGPDDTDVWTSRVGLSLLGSQHRRIVLGNGRDLSFRLALCPFELGLPTAQRDRFLEMMEVQWLCGIDIRVVTPGHVERTTGNARHVVGGFGRGFAAEWEWGRHSMEPQNASIHFEIDRIKSLWEQYSEMVAHAVPWGDYKVVQGVTFSPERTLFIQELVRKVLQLAGHPDASQ